MISIPFVKMHGAGNDYVYLDLINGELKKNSDRNPVDEDQLSELAILMADRHYGVGGDGLVLIVRGSTQPVRMRMFNPDGSEAEMCGNAIRCVARYVRDTELATCNQFKIQTMLRDVGVEVLSDGRVCADMGAPHSFDDGKEISSEPREPEILNVDGADYSVTLVSMGNPHAVVFVEDMNFDLSAIGNNFEQHPRFPNRTNTEFVVPISEEQLRMRVWERGAGETLACGTGACAAAVAAVVTGRTKRKVTIHLPGGELDINWSVTNNHVYMTGPAEYVFRGTFSCKITQGGFDGQN